jgi:hypothetical protein
MGRFVVKVAPTRDLYMEWTTVAEGPTYVGTRTQMATHLAADGTRSNGLVQQILARASTQGTSSSIGAGGWNDIGMIYAQQGWLHPAQFEALADRFAAAGRGEYEYLDLLELFDDDTEEVAQ